MHRLLVLALACLMLGAGLVGSRVVAHAAQPATPAAMSGQPLGVPPAECQVEPRPAEEMFAVLGITEAAGDGDAVAPERTPVPAPPWEAADPETAAMATAVIREWLACINADDNFRIAALMTDAAVIRFFGGALDPDEAIEGARTNLAGTPTPRPAAGYAQLVAVTDVANLDDGRVVALALINEPVLPPQGQETLLVILEWAGSGLYIGDIIQFSTVPVTGGTPQAGTPQP